MKKITLLLIISMALSVCFVFAAPQPTLLINGKVLQSDVPPEIVGDRIMLPARAFFEYFGAKVDWIAASNEVKITASKVIVLKIDSSTVYVNGSAVSIDTPPYIKNGRTMLPARFISETLGCTVTWDQARRTAIIATPLAQNAIQKIAYQFSTNQVVASITLLAPLTSKSEYTLQGPDRYVLDLSGVSCDSSSQEAIASLYVTRLRIGPHTDYTRLVFDLSCGMNVKTTLSKDKKTIYVTFLTPSSTNQVVVIDPGHGGSDPGALAEGIDGKVFNEKDINLAVALELERRLSSAGIRVIMTRKTDLYVTLEERSAIANRQGAALFVSVHSNSIENADTNGTLVLYSPRKDEQLSTGRFSSGTLADNILPYLTTALGTTDKGARDGSEMFVIRNTSMPAVIVELAYMSNAQDRAKLLAASTPANAAGAICSGILDTLQTK